MFEKLTKKKQMYLNTQIYLMFYKILIIVIYITTYYI